ncbi:hypothetical protein CDD83_10558 [Cordyceps sp. RAO-2017]|nr:hypothetical protein CDD83_10558 [Cordyceps sp. RAO-2017]
MPSRQQAATFRDRGLTMTGGPYPLNDFAADISDPDPDPNSRLEPDKDAATQAPEAWPMCPAVSSENSASKAPGWPMIKIPTEIFELIIRHVSRPDIQALRLVCREFDCKVSPRYFRNVVVPFKAELYSYSPPPGQSQLFSSGMRIFQSFGPCIRHFALSLEVDEDLLAFPPLKTTHQAVPSFWGVYRWPHPNYRRYQDLEGIETTADETDSMRKALRCLKNVTNVGLCCDAGLGFLFGPDKVAREATAQQPVFATRDWRSKADAADGPAVAVGHGPRLLRGTRECATLVNRRTLAMMVLDAGYHGAQEVEEAIRLLLALEGTTLSAIDIDGRSPRHGHICELEDSDDDEGSLSYDSTTSRFSPPHPLIPNSLTVAQMEMLLELEWAHRAMIQSYVIALADNGSDGCFANLTTLTLAKISSRHLQILCRDELWDGIPSLRHIFLAVIADWRTITVSTADVLQDLTVSPSDAVGKAFRLLNGYIGKRSNIESIHFEWICGGELAPGLCLRNMYILPGPFFEKPDYMSECKGLVRHTEELLHLPHARHLSLKNFAGKA